MPGLISAPIYLPFYALLNSNERMQPGYLFNLSFTLEKISASTFASLNVVLFFLLIFKLSQSIKTGIAFAFIFAFATQTFSISSQYLWQHGIANLFMTVSQLFLISKIFIISSLASLLSIWTRPHFLIYGGLLLRLLYQLDKKKFVSYLTILVGGLILLASFNIYLYGSPFGGYFDHVSVYGKTTFIKNAIGLFLSPARGVVFYTPLFILACLTPLFYKKIGQLPTLQKNIYYLNFFNLLGVILLNSFWGEWWGGHSWGSRLLADATVSAIILVYFLYIFNKSILFKVILTIIVIYSVIVQAIGIFYYPRAFWDFYPKDVNGSTEKLWDFKDNPIIRQLVAGPQLEGVYNFINFSKGLKNREYIFSERKCSLEYIGKKNLLGYEVLELYFMNNSQVDWLTTGTRGYLNLNLREVFTREGKLFDSPITSALPRVIKSGEKVKVNLLIIPPNQNNYNLLVFPTQEGISPWISSCKLII
ncbi:MAG: hypothetical protein Q8P92_01380 [Candidatus Daviesbacteria bacterium]|nr:hypothetical protein [Candidatus Daviesbacteria bacterium]